MFSFVSVCSMGDAKLLESATDACLNIAEVRERRMLALLQGSCGLVRVVSSQKCGARFMFEQACQVRNTGCFFRG
jgi:hypothetical protein